jgi:threonylcarbamoyladenosine tRNA methylthiotransferase MtaB
VAVCGCYSQIEAEEVEKLGASVIFGAADRTEFIEEVEKALHGSEGCRNIDQPFKRRNFELLPAGAMDHRTRAMLKIQDGCVNFCSYCIIPYTRGPVRSAPLELAVQQAKELADRGYREIVVTGIEIASWGVDLPGKPEPTVMIEAVCQAVPELRVRLGSLEPRIVTEDFCERLRKLPNLCPQFHLSMQSGCDTVLARMKRKYDTARYYESVRLLNAYFPGCAVTTDMIVAFPGETEEEFRQSLDFIRKCAFADMHIFPYSRRPGTPADKMPMQHSNATKEERSRRAIAVAEDMSRAYRQGLVGTVQQVLFEEEDGGFFTGHAPNSVKIYASGKDLHNEIRNVRVTALHKEGVLGEIVE